MIQAKQKILQGYNNYCLKIDRILDDLEKTDPERLNRRPGGIGWSALQTLHHMLLAETLSLRYVQKKLPFAHETEKPGWRHHLRLILLMTSLRSPIKFKAPSTLGLEYLPERSTLSDVRAQWQRTRTEWIRFLQDLPEEAVEKAVYRHPRVGRLSWTGMMTFLSFHTNRHSRQISRAVKSEE